MANLQKNLEAAQAFLSGMRTLSAYEAVERKQAAGLAVAQRREGERPDASPSGGLPTVHGREPVARRNHGRVESPSGREDAGGDRRDLAGQAADAGLPVARGDAHSGAG